MKKYSKRDQILFAKWAADCAEHVKPLFEKIRPNDDRPRKAVETCRTWVQTGEFKMAAIRGASLNAHAAARESIENIAACFAARAAGQAVASAHVSQHAFGASYYALKAVAAVDPVNAKENVPAEFKWQLRRAPPNLIDEILRRVTIQMDDKVAVKILKDADF